MKPCEERFYDNLSSFKPVIVNSLKCSGSSIGPELIEMAFEIMGSVNKKLIVEQFIERTYPLWDQINEGKNLGTILEKSFDLFGEIGDNNVKEIARVVNEQIDDKEKVEEFLRFVRSLVKISIKYVYNARKTTTKFMNHVDVEGYSTKYKIINLAA